MYRNLSQLVDVRGQVKRNGSFKRRSWSQITGISRHHSATTVGDAFSFANYHVDSLGWPSVGYHFVITRDGTIQWANSINRVSYHTGRNNTPLIGICVVGSGSFTRAQEKSYFELVVALMRTKGLNLGVASNRGHNEYPGHRANACPGISMNQVRAAIRAGHPVGEQSKTPKGTDSGQSLRSGDKGDDVKQLQKDLLEVGEDLPRFGADGDFGGETEEAVKSFQTKHDISSPQGQNFGVAGPATMAKLEELLVPKETAITEKMAVVLTEVLNVRNQPSFSDDVVAGQVTKGEAFTVVKKVSVPGSSTDMYKLKSGLYISAHESYTELKDVPQGEEEELKRMVIVDTELLNVRDRPSFAPDAIVGQVTEGEAFTIKNTVKAEDSKQELYQLISGLYITTNKNYVQIREVK